MESSSTIGILLLLLGAVCGGCFGLPSKFAGKDTPWETLWGPFFLFVTVLIPTTIFPLIAKGLFATCATVGLSALLPVLIFGFLWGLGSMALGMSFAFIGLSLAYAINYGAQIACGGVGPMMIHNRDQAGTPHGLVILVGVAICIVGVAVCGRAALLRETSQKAGTTSASTAGQPNMTKGLTLAMLSGALCACYSIAFSYGGQVMDVSVKQFGNEGWRAAFVVSALILWGGSLSACGACVVKLCRNRTWGSFAKPGIGRVLLVALAMALLHDGAILFFGVGASMLGALGIAVGYAVFMSFAIIIGNFNGFVTREWKGASTRSVAWLAAGILVLVVGVSALARGNYMQGQASKPTVSEAVKGDVFATK
jgi:L-rhamnose-H+ transport protein